MTAIVILAAGASTRLGKAKQTLLYRNLSLLKYTAKAAVNAHVGPVLVVIGARESEIRAELENEPVSVIVNNDWHTGIASSIKKGVVWLKNLEEKVESVILMVCDQPYVDETLLISLVKTKLVKNKPIVACAYKNTVGVPALFGKEFFDELLLLEGEEGGKKVLLKHISSVTTIPFEKGEIDIDTMDDYINLNQLSES